MCERGDKKENCFLGRYCCSQLSALRRLLTALLQDEAVGASMAPAGCEGCMPRHYLMGLWVHQWRHGLEALPVASGWKQCGYSRPWGCDCVYSRFGNI